MLTWYGIHLQKKDLKMKFRKFQIFLDVFLFSHISLQNKTRVLVSGRNPECSDCFLGTMEQKKNDKFKCNKLKLKN